VTRLCGLLGVWVGWRLVRLVWTNSFNFPEAVAEQSFVRGDAMSCSGEELGPLSFSVGGWSACGLVCLRAGLLGGLSALSWRRSVGLDFGPLIDLDLSIAGVTPGFVRV